jgi:hypothetical protein
MADLGLSEAREEVARIKGLVAGGDYDEEALHGAEDSLYLRALRAIRDGHPQSAELAGIVVEVADVSYDRWYA